ncbi:MAG TPA: HepT-like ribonuclease domain-containing protein [Prolixibacteraceae bacterium]|nr:HepT-like ribonuclease domain-containing protein [Prolixibacteraceae bacterium]
MKRADKYLLDILMSIEYIEEFIPTDYSFLDYLKDRKTSSSVERQLAIIGEAVNQYEKLNPNISLKNTGQIIAMRNRLIHAYDSIDDNVIWSAIKKDLPLLKKEAKQIMNDFE